MSVDAETDTGAEPEKGRQRSARGEIRRQALVEAAAEVVMRSGFTGVSHRSVAQQADLPLAATTYYFDSLEDLLAEALDHLAEGWLVTARETVDRLPSRVRGRARLASAVLELVALSPGGLEGPDAVLALYERYLEAARHPSLQHVVRRYDGQLDALVGELLSRTDLPQTTRTARLVIACADGALVRALAEGGDIADAHRTLVTLVEHLAPVAQRSR